MFECFRGVAHPWLCDAMGHLTTRHYVGMFDDGAYHLFAKLGLTPAHMEAGTGIADVKSTIHYKHEVRSGELVLVEGTVRRVGSTSIGTFYRMTILHSGKVAAEMENVSVQFDLNARSAVPILPEIRRNAEALLAAPAPEDSAQ
jgi:acyl-CoA thioester hydrolase